MFTRTRICRGCKTLFVTHKNQQIYCSSECRKAKVKEDYGVSHIKPQRSTATTGAISELKACAYLLERGHDVFRAVSPSCPCDLIAMKDGAILRVEVRTGRYNSTKSTIGYPRSDSDKGKQDITLVVLPDNILCMPPGIL